MKWCIGSTGCVSSTSCVVGSDGGGLSDWAAALRGTLEGGIRLEGSLSGREGRTLANSRGIGGRNRFIGQKLTQLTTFVHSSRLEKISSNQVGHKVVWCLPLLSTFILGGPIVNPFSASYISK